MQNEQNLFDIYDYWHVPFWQTKSFMLIAILSGVLLFVGLSIFFVMKKSKKKKSLSPSQQALYELELLKKKPIQTREDAHGAYFKLTAILKKFFQSHYASSFESMTDMQMVEALKKTASPETIARLDELVNSSLGVKYAQENALQKDFTNQVNMCIELIKEMIVK